MDKGSEEYKAFFLELAKSYNEEVEFENQHRNYMFRHTIACIIWITGSILAAWKIIDFNDLLDPYSITASGAALVAILLVQLVCIHRKHKRQVAHCLKLRQLALEFKDGLH